jgi:hypothetical protein
MELFAVMGMDRSMSTQGLEAFDSVVGAAAACHDWLRTEMVVRKSKDVMIKG